ncbi:MAG: sulfatase-like hydrolase/transferase [Pseudomonadota bacterium]|nr:sulfatase-like hydrolase/transferase [Pseudomonadota bacterium]
MIEGSSMPTQPNLLFIFADQHRHDAMGCAGNRLIETPNIDRLAATGVRFANAWCQSPVCQPSRAAMITGRYPHKLNVMRNFGPDMDDAWPTFMKQLQGAGYRTANIGKTHYYAQGLIEPDGQTDMRDMVPRVRRFGFDHVVEEFDRYVHALDEITTPYTQYLKSEGVFDTYCDQIRAIWRLTDQHWDGVTSPLHKEQDLTSFLTRQAQAWLADQSPEQPFFLQLSYVQPHVPLMGDPDWADYYRDLAIPRGPVGDGFEATPEWADYLDWCRRHANAHLLTDEYVLAGARQYYAMISLIDECVGNIVSQLERQGLEENTFIIYASDHGEMLGDHGLMAKFNFYRSSVQIPLILRPPGGLTGKTSEALAQLIDIGPTMLDAAGAQPLNNADGCSLMPVLRDESFARQVLFSEIQKGSRETSAPTFRALRNHRHRFTLETSTLTPCELFDLEDDPDELRNLVTERQFGPLIEQFSQQISALISADRAV